VPFHAATHYPPVDHTEEDTGPTAPPESEYFGLVDDDHIRTVIELADRADVPRFVRQHPRDVNQFFVLRDDGFLDHYHYVPSEEVT
jgi:hypothetical protein